MLKNLCLFDQKTIKKLFKNCPPRKQRDFWNLIPWKSLCKLDFQIFYVATCWWFSSKRLQVEIVETFLRKCFRIVRFVSLGFFGDVFVSLYLFQWWCFDNTENTAFRGNNCCLHSQFLTHINVFVQGNVAGYWRCWLWRRRKRVSFYTPKGLQRLNFPPNTQLVNGDGKYWAIVLAQNTLYCYRDQRKVTVMYLFDVPMLIGIPINLIHFSLPLQNLHWLLWTGSQL